MRVFRKCLGVLLAAALLSALCLSALATDGYSYRVTLSAGSKGSFSGSSTIELEGITYDASGRINLTSYLDQVTLENEKYYVKGFHLSGQEDLVASVPMTGDAVYVVSYGVRGNTVQYTIHYQDAEGNTLADSVQFYGNVGDKPVVAFLYIEGYQPQAYNLTKTLAENEAENVFTFVYTPVTPAAAEPATPTEPTTPATTPETPVTPTEPEETTPAEPEEQPEEEQPTQDIEDNETPQTSPDEILDLDDANTPLGDQLPGDDTTETKPGKGLLIGGGAVGIGLLIFLIGFLLSRKKKKGAK